MANFLSLSTEIRVRIYRGLLIPQADLLSNRNTSRIEIDDISPERYMMGIEFDSIVHRTRYRPTPVQVLRCACRIRFMGRCVELRPQLQTSYTHTGHDLHTGILSVNRQISEESRHIFYSNNTFHFKSMSAVLPFLQDRQTSWPYIKRLSFFLPLDNHGHASWKHQEYVQIFDTIVTSATLNLSTLNLTISDSQHVGLEPNGRRQGVLRWLQNVVRMRNLDRLTVEVFLDDIRTGGPRCGGWIRGVNTKWNGTPAYCVDTKIWCYLAPNVLRTGRVPAANWAVAAFRVTAPLIFDPENPYLYHWY